MASGFLEGYLDMQQNERANNAAGISNQINQTILQEDQLSLAAAQRNAALLQQKRAMAAQVPVGLPLSEKYQALSGMLFGTDPDTALEFSGQAVKQQDAEFKLAQEKRQFLQQGLTEGADIASGVKDQDGANDLWDWADRTKVQLPAWVPKVYNEQTAPAFQRLGNFFQSAKDREALAKTAEGIQYTQHRDAQIDVRNQQLDRRADQRDREEDRKDAMLQAGLDKENFREGQADAAKKARLTRPATMTEIETSMATIKSYAEDQGIQLPRSIDDKQAMAGDVHKIRNGLLTQNPDMDPEEAEDQAMQTVMGRVQGGKYKPTSVKEVLQKAKQAATVPPAAGADASTATPKTPALKGLGSQQSPVVLDSPEAINAAGKLPKGTWMTAPGRGTWQKPN